MTARIISVFNQKGGVGKTTTAVNLAANLASKYAYKVLLIDLDSQASATSYVLGEDQGRVSATVVKSLLSDDKAPVMLSDLILKTPIKNLYLIPADITLSEVENNIFDRYGRERILEKRLGNLVEKFGFIIIDCHPSLSPFHWKSPQGSPVFWFIFQLFGEGKNQVAWLGRW
ncbi:ParA family protein [Planctomycetota bacterium]